MKTVQLIVTMEVSDDVSAERVCEEVEIGLTNLFVEEPGEWVASRVSAQVSK